MAGEKIKQRFLEVDQDLRPFTPTPKKRNLELLKGIMLGGSTDSDEEKPESIIGTLVNNKGEITSVQNPNRPLKNINRPKE